MYKVWLLYRRHKRDEGRSAECEGGRGGWRWRGSMGLSAEQREGKEIRGGTMGE